MYVLELAGDDDPFAAAEAAAAAATDVRVVAPGVALADAVDAERARRLAFTRRVGRVVGRTRADVDAAVGALEDAVLDAVGTVAVRARDVRTTAGVDTQRAERELGHVLVERGCDVDLTRPDRELRALFADDVCVLAWLVCESERGYGDRDPTDRPFFQPGSMAPLLARAVVNLADAGPGDRLLDPMCGTGGLLIEAGLVGARPVGLDAQWKMTRGTRRNLDAYLGDAAASEGSGEVLRGDAARLPFRDGSVDCVAFDAPYGRQSKVATHGLDDLVEGALAEARRVADRGVVVADRDQSDAAVAAGWRVTRRFERRVHRSLTRHVHVLR